MATMQETTRYSRVIPGVRGNHGWSAKFEVTGGFVGIVQVDGGDIGERVLLSPRQFRELVKFVSEVSPDA